MSQHAGQCWFSTMGCIARTVSVAVSWTSFRSAQICQIVCGVGPTPVDTNTDDLDLTLGIFITGGISSVCGNSECLKNCEAAKKQLPV